MFFKQIVTLPYPLLLQKSSREALGISLKGHIVIIDEAHNLMDTISSIHSITVSLPQLEKSHKGLDLYISKFRNKLKGCNKVYVMQLHGLLDGLKTYLEGRRGEGTVEVGDLLATKGIDQINIDELQKYIVESKLARKVEAYLDYEKRRERNLQQTIVAQENNTTPTLTHVLGFLSTLTYPSSEGQLFYGMTSLKESYLKYMLLDPAHHFKSVVEEARAVILAGGTMEPVRSAGPVSILLLTLTRWKIIKHISFLMLHQNE